MNYTDFISLAVKSYPEKLREHLQTTKDSMTGTVVKDVPKSLLINLRDSYFKIEWERITKQSCPNLSDSNFVLVSLLELKQIKDRLKEIGLTSLEFLNGAELKKKDEPKKSK